jgi:hypothetical protein
MWKAVPCIFLVVFAIKRRLCKAAKYRLFMTKQLGKDFSFWGIWLRYLYVSVGCDVFCPGVNSFHVSWHRTESILRRNNFLAI